MKETEVKEQWQRLSMELGFEFKEGVKALLDSPNLIVMSEVGGMGKSPEDIEQVREFIQSPFLSKILDKIFIGTTTGFYKDFEFHLFQSSTHSISSSSDLGLSRPIYYVNIVLLFKESYQLGMQIKYADWWSKIRRKLGGSYIRIHHNSELDRLISVKGKNEARIESLLSDSAIQEKIQRLYSFSKNFTITDYGIRWRRKGEIISKQEAREIMDIMAETAQEF